MIDTSLMYVCVSSLLHQTCTTQQTT